MDRLREHIGKTYYGSIREFQETRGYGFIQAEGTVDPYLFPSGRIFYHIKSLVPKPRSNTEAAILFLGRRVRFRLGLNPRNMKVFAQSVSLAGSGSPVDERSASVSSYGSLGSPLDNLIDLEDDEPLSGLLDHLAYFSLESPARHHEFNTALALTEEEKALKRQAVEMGFDVALVDRVFLSTDVDGGRRHYTDLQTLLDELFNFQAVEGVDLGGTFDPTSDDFLVNTYMRQAENMGFPQELALDALSGHAGGFATFEALMDRMMELQAEKQATSALTGADLASRGIASKSVLPPRPRKCLRSYENRARKLRKENEDIQTMFSCKICMDASSVVAFVPCGHLCCCVHCASTSVQSMCPVCRQNVREKQFLDLGTSVASNDGRPVKNSLKDELATLEAENQTLKASRLCRGCKLRDRSSYFLPCRHLVYCETCSGQTNICPQCTLPVIRKTTIFIV